MSMLGMFFGFLVITVVLGGANYYVAKRIFVCIRYVFANIDAKIYAGIAVFMALVMILGFLRSMLPLPVSAKNIIGGVSMYWMGIFIYLFVFFVIADGVFYVAKLLKLIPNPVPGNMRFYAGISVAVLTVVMVGYGIYNAGRIEKVTYDVELTQRELQGEVNMVLISDLHLGALGSEKRVMEAVEEINKMNPDIVCIAGDIFDNDYYAIKNPEQVAECLRRIKSKYGVYACLGNHDAGKTMNKLIEFIQMSNINLLADKSVVIDERFILVGRLDETPIGSNGGLERAETEVVLKNIDKTLPVIVLDHNPQHIDEYKNDVDLILSGHTHKGQLFPANIITGLMYTVDYGHYRKNNESPHVIVTSGLGTWGMPMRVGTDCEIVNIRIK